MENPPQPPQSGPPKKPGVKKRPPPRGAAGPAKKAGAPSAAPESKKLSNRTLKLLILAGVGFIALLAAGTSVYFHLKAPAETGQAAEGEATPAPESPLPQTVQDLVAAGKFGDAIDQIRPMVDADPKNIPLLNEAARINLMAERYQEAHRLSKKILELEPDHAFSHAVVAVALFNTSQFEEALKESLKAIDLDPKESLPYLTIGDIYLRQGKIDDGITVLKQAARLNSNNADTWTRLSSAYIKKQDYDKARLACEAALHANPNYAGAYFNLAYVYFRKEDASNALKNIQKAEDLYTAQQNINWMAKTRHSKDMYIKHFKIRPEDVIG